jgi:hypothetical protein
MIASDDQSASDEYKSSRYSVGTLLLTPRMRRTIRNDDVKMGFLSFGACTVAVVEP